MKESVDRSLLVPVSDVIREENGLWDAAVCCPKCGVTKYGANDYTHAVAVSVLRGTDEIVINAGDAISIRPAVNPGRGVVISIDFECECGHAFRLMFKFHKGQTGLEVERLADYDPSSAGACVIWRD